MKWDEAKRIKNLMKHGLNFKDANKYLRARFALMWKRCGIMSDVHSRLFMYLTVWLC